MNQAVIFDMDGTLFDTEPVLHRAWVKLVEKGRVPTDILELLPRMVGKNRLTIHRELLAHYGNSFPLDDIYRERDVLIQAELNERGVPLKPGVPEIFDTLRGRGYRLALATSTSAPSVADYMRRTGLAKHFDVIVTGDRVENGKPAPDIFLLAAKELGLTPDRCTVIEDSHNGVRAGAAAGMDVVMIPDIQSATEEMRSLAKHICESLWELPRLLPSF